MGVRMYLATEPTVVPVAAAAAAAAVASTAAAAAATLLYIGDGSPPAAAGVVPSAANAAHNAWNQGPADIAPHVIHHILNPSVLS